MVCDSHSTKPSSSIVGTSEFGFIFMYSGVLVTPNCMPASVRSYLSPSSSATHSAFFTLTELILPQIFSMSGGVLEVHVLECKHWNQFLLGPCGKTAAVDEPDRVLVGSEHSIPERNVAEVVLVHIELVVDRVQLGRLDEISQPGRHADVRVVQVLADTGQKVVPDSSRERAPEQRVKNHRAEQCVAQNFDGMLVERSCELDARGRVVDLMENQPPALCVPQAMPPVKEERAREPGGEAFEERD